MALNLDRFEKFAEKLYIRDRDTGETHPFRFNPSQRKINEIIKAKRDSRIPLNVIFLKARRVGVSTWATALATAHANSKKGSSGKQVAQLNETADTLYAMTMEFGKQLKKRGLDVKVTEAETIYNFPARDGKPALKSDITSSTAKTVIGGRGLTCSFLHLSEAAFYPGEDSFVSLLNTMSKDPDNIVIIETTANGIEGPGATFHKYWEGAVAGTNGFIPIFLPWYEDPGLTMPEEMAPDAPADDYERFLMKDIGCTRSQIAWYRYTLEVKCAGSIAKMRQENPTTPEEAFIATGTPAFDAEELGKAKRWEKDPLVRGYMRQSEDNPDQYEFVEDRAGNLHIWEFPQIEKDGNPAAHYFMGVDAAKGVEDGDFAAIVGFNGCTGKQAFRWADRCSPENTAPVVNALARWYNKAMVNIEFTGGWGYIIAKELRDKYHFPNQYFWRARDDSMETKGRKSMGWETNNRSRRMLIDVFRVAIRRLECLPRDAALIAQMSRASMEMGFNWVVIRGHDDILMAGFLAWIAVEHYHFPHSKERAKGSTLPKADSEGAEGETPKMPAWMTDPTLTVQGRLLTNSNHHLRFLERYNKRKGKVNALEGI